MNILEIAAARTLGIDPPRNERKVRRRVLVTPANFGAFGLALMAEDAVEAIDKPFVIEAGGELYEIPHRVYAHDVELYESDAVKLDGMVEKMTEAEYRLCTGHLESAVKQHVEGDGDNAARSFDTFPGSWPASVRAMLRREPSPVLEVIDPESDKGKSGKKS